MSGQRRSIRTIEDARAVSNAALLSLSETARITGLNFRTVKAGIESGAIPSVRVAERVFVPRAALFAMLGVAESEPDSDRAQS